MRAARPHTQSERVTMARKCPAHTTMFDSTDTPGSSAKRAFQGCKVRLRGEGNGEYRAPGCESRECPENDNTRHTDAVLGNLYPWIDDETDYLTISVFTPDALIKHMEPVEVLLHLRENEGLVEAVHYGDSAMIFKSADSVMVVSYTRQERLFSLYELKWDYQSIFGKKYENLTSLVLNTGHSIEDNTMEHTKKRCLTFTQMCAEAIGRKFGKEAAQEHLDAITNQKLLRHAEENFAVLDEKASTFH